MANKCTACDYPVNVLALFCRGCGSVTTRDPDAVKTPKPPTKWQVTHQRNKQWAEYLKQHGRCAV